MYTADLVRILNNVAKIDKLNNDPDTQGAYLINRKDHLVVLATNGNILYWEQVPIAVDDKVKSSLVEDFAAEKKFFPCRITPGSLQRAIVRLKAESKTSLVQLLGWERNVVSDTETVTLKLTDRGNDSYEALPVQPNDRIRYKVRDVDRFYELFILHEHEFPHRYQPMPFNVGFAVPAKQMAAISAIMSPLSKTGPDGMDMVVYGSMGKWEEEGVIRRSIYPSLIDIRDFGKEPDEQTRGVVVTTMRNDKREVYFI